MNERDADVAQVLAARQTLLDAGYTTAQCAALLPLPAPETELERKWAKP